MTCPARKHALCHWSLLAHLPVEFSEQVKDFYGDNLCQASVRVVRTFLRRLLPSSFVLINLWRTVDEGVGAG